MEIKKNDKYKKKYILKQVQNKWGYSKLENNLILVKNCILKNKYNKIYQIIFHAGEAMDGLYLINSFDINMQYDKERRVFTITSKKYDKIAGYDDCTINSFNNKNTFINWLIQENFLTEQELALINAKVIKDAELENMEEFILDS